MKVRRKGSKTKKKAVRTTSRKEDNEGRTEIGEDRERRRTKEGEPRCAQSPSEELPLWSP